MSALTDLAVFEEVDPTYWEVDGTRHEASPEALVAILRALGVPLGGPDDAAAVLAERAAERWRCPLEPCLAVFAGEPAALVIRAPESADGATLVAIELEAGQGTRRFTVDLGELLVSASAEVDGVRHLARDAALPADLPIGYHRVRVDGAVAGDCHLLVSPRRAYRPPGERRAFGVFAPVYALRSADQLGVGDLGDLGRVAAHVAQLGGELVGTLPLLACSYGEPYSESPYSPLSRMFWNDLYADLRPAAWRGLGLPGADELADSAIAEAAAPLGALDLVDYRRAAALKRAVLDRLVAAVWRDPAARARVEAFAAARPRLDDYARFRAFGEAERRPWRDWPARERDGHIGDGAFDPAAHRAHLLGQFVMTAQLAAFKATPGGAGLYLDLPVGVDAAGYDVWRERDAFAHGISVGAPPDPLAAGGQDWALPPLHPRHQRRDGYRAFADCIRAHMEHASMLRVDHVMGLHRLFWIPAGCRGSDGVYVRYRADELYAVLCIESHRQRCALAGEDLGTVPDQVRPAMADRGVRRLFVAEFGWAWRDGRPEVDPPPAGSVASLDTHDTATFAAFAERQGFDSGEEVMHRWTDAMAESDADVVLVTLEDLWLERAPQNVPGTTSDEEPNWRRRMARTVDQICTDPVVASTLARVASLRKERAS